MATVIQEEIHSYPSPHCTISWGAVIAGLVFMFALSWLLLTLGSAVGLSVSDVPDPNRTEPQKMVFSLSPFAWVFISTLAAFFLGGVMAGRLAGKADRILGMLHGVTVWASAVILSLVLGSFGIGGVTISSMNIANTNELMRSHGMQTKDLPADSRPLGEIGIKGVVVLSASENPLGDAPTGNENGHVLLEYAAGTHWLVFVSNATALVLAILGSSIGAAGVARTYLRNRF